MKNQKYLEYLIPFLTKRRLELFDTVLEQRTKHFTVVLEDIFQKHNTSAVVRSCDIFGIQDIHIIEKRYNSYVSNQVAKGAQKWLNFNTYNQDEDNTAVCIDSLKAKGYQIIATTPHNESCYLPEFDISKKTAFFFGVEKAGLSDQVMQKADGFLKIPMVGFTESLNISVAVAIILQSVTSKLKQSDVAWQLSEAEKLHTKIAWIENSIKSITQIKERYKAEYK